MIKKTVRNVCYGTTRSLGLQWLFGLRARGVTAVMFHGVVPSIDFPKIQQNQQLASVFEAQINYLKKYFEVISLEDFLERIHDKNGFDGRQVLLTFDDGYLNNLTIAAPILSERNLPFAVFVNSKNIEEGMRQPTYYCRVAPTHTDKRRFELRSMNSVFDIPHDEDRIIARNKIIHFVKTQPQTIVNEVIEELKILLSQDRWAELNHLYHSEALLTWDEARELQTMGATIGSHCHDHAILHNNQTSEEIKYQLSTSKEVIEKQLGPCFALAYPNGGKNNVSLEAIRLSKKCGYQLAFSAVLGETQKTSTLHCLPRIVATDSINSFVWHIHSAWRYNKRFEKWRQGLQNGFAK